MKTTIFTFALILSSVFSFAQSFDADARTIVKSLPICEKELIIDLGCDVTVMPWKGDHVRLLIEVKLESHRAELIRELAKMGRYDVHMDSGQFECILTMPQLKQIVKINGIMLKEHVQFKVLMPEGMESTINAQGAIALTKKAEALNS